MFIDKHLICVKTLTDSHLEEFMRCPYKFYHQKILKIHSGLNWRQVVQLSVNKIVKEYFQTPVSHRSSHQILVLIDKYWRPITVDLFDSKAHYYSVLAKVSDHLLQFLIKEKNHEPPLFLNEKLNVFVDELDMNLSVSFQVAEWSKNSFVVKKYLLESTPSFLQAFRNMIVVFSKKAFNKLPEKIEAYSLMNNKVIEFFPQEADVEKAMFDLKLTKIVFTDRKSYKQFTNSDECTVCPLKRECDHGHPLSEKRQTILYM